MTSERDYTQVTTVEDLKKTHPAYNWPVRKPLLKFDLTQKGGCRLRQMERSHSPTPIAYAKRFETTVQSAIGTSPTRRSVDQSDVAPDSFRPGSRSTCSVVVRIFPTESPVFSSPPQRNLRRSTRQRSRSSARIRVGGCVFRSRRRIRAPGAFLFSGFRAPRSVLYFKMAGKCALITGALMSFGGFAKSRFSSFFSSEISHFNDVFAFAVIDKRFSAIRLSI